MISQLTLFIENEKGRLAAATRAVADAGIDMHSLYVADTADFGVVRMLCDTPKAAAAKLQEAGWRATATNVVAVAVPDEVGGLAKLLEALDANDINLEYGYCISTEGGKAIDILKVSEAEGVEEALAKAGFDVLKPEDIYVVD
jgi:hypothetical protein